MRIAFIAALAIAVSAIYDPSAATGPEIIPGEYIVVLKKGVSMQAHKASMVALVNQTNTMHTYEIGEDFAGYAVKLGEAEAKALAAHADVKYVEPNMVARALQTCTQYPAPHSWGLARTVRRGPVSDGPPIAQSPYELNDLSNGRGIDVHVIDTGVYCANNDFNNRPGAPTCVMSFDATNEGMFDGNGHGTHVASTAAGNRFGLAKAANVVGVKVLGSNGSGSFAGVIAGINFSANAARTGRRIVGNMSLGGGRNQGVNDATDASFRAGLVMVVAAGNSNNNACNSSPASADLAFTVMSTDQTDGRSTFSSFGPCCQIFAPGTGITAAWIGAPERTNTISGTSMASPHVAGVAAKIWSRNNALNNQGVQDALLRISTPNSGLIRNPGAGSPPAFLLHQCSSE